MKELLNRLVVTNTDEEMDNAESTSDSENSDSVEWTDVSADDAIDGSQNGPDRLTESVDASSADSHSTPDTAATSDEVDSMDADQLLGNVLNGIAVPTLVVDSAGRISHINSNACERFET